MIAVLEFLAIPEFREALGWVFALAILLGGFLDNHGRDLLQWVLAVVVFAVCQAWAALIIMESITGVRADHVTIFSGLVLVVYTVGLALGWLFAVYSRNRWRAGHKTSLSPDTQELRVVLQRLRDIVDTEEEGKHDD